MIVNLFLRVTTPKPDRWIQLFCYYPTSPKHNCSVSLEREDEKNQWQSIISTAYQGPWQGDDWKDAEQIDNAKCREKKCQLFTVIATNAVIMSRNGNF